MAELNEIPTSEDLTESGTLPLKPQNVAQEQMEVDEAHQTSTTSDENGVVHSTIKTTTDSTITENSITSNELTATTTAVPSTEFTSTDVESMIAIESNMQPTTESEFITKSSTNLNADITIESNTTEHSSTTKIAPVGTSTENVTKSNEYDDSFTTAESALWEVLQDNPTNFDKWTQLLLLIEQSGKIGSICKVYDAFLACYPYCYGYWKKYADLKQKLVGNESSKDVLERGVIAIPLSIELWLHYLKFAQTAYSDTTDYVTRIHSLYERAIEACGLDYRSDKLWVSFVDWEKVYGTPLSVMDVYSRLLATPTQEYKEHLSSFTEFVNASSPSELLSPKEYELMSSSLSGGEKLTEDEKTPYLRQKIIEKYYGIFTANEEEVNKRVVYEDMIKRPYFHTKPLEKAQLKNWLNYLDFEISQNDLRRIIVLFERCLLACCLYEEFWIKFAEYVEENHTKEYTQFVYSRACQTHLTHKPALHLAWAAYEEKQGNILLAKQILCNIDQSTPGHVMVRVRRIGLEMRQGHLLDAETLLVKSISETEDREAKQFYTWQYAQFTVKFLNNFEKAIAMMKEVIEKDEGNIMLYLQLLDLHLSQTPVNEDSVLSVFDLVENNEQLSYNDKISFLNRKVLFLEQNSSSIHRIIKGHKDLDKLKTKSYDLKRSTSTSNDGRETKKLKQDTDNELYHTQWSSYSQQQWGGGNYHQSYPFQQHWQGYHYPTHQ